MKVLIACEESQRTCTAFRERGHEAYSCDMQEPSGGHPEWHILGDCLPIIVGGGITTMDGVEHAIGKWDLIIAHPPCTYLSNLGNTHLYHGTERVQRQKDTFRLMNEERIKSGIRARDFFMALLNAPCEKIAIENPVPSGLWQLPEASQAIQPYMFGDPYKKKTLLWLKGLRPLTPTNIVEPVGRWVDGGHKGADDLKVFGYRDPKKRSKTFLGIARAFAEQWG